jgi:hypothetical protein
MIPFGQLENIHMVKTANSQGIDSNVGELVFLAEPQNVIANECNNHSGVADMIACWTHTQKKRVSRRPKRCRRDLDEA